MRKYFTEVDDCIMAAYNHVKQTSYKMRSYQVRDIDNIQTELGYISEDNHLFLMTIENHNSSSKRKLSTQIKKFGIQIIDVVNKQLITFL